MPVNQQIRREYRGDVLYVYDRVCPKESKRQQISRTYGCVGSEKQRRNEERIYGKAFAQAQHQRAKASSAGSDSAAASYAQAERRNRNAGAENRPRSYSAYTYRPGPAAGGEAVRTRPIKLMMERIINFFESIEERGRRDEAIAKKHAVAWKKFSEYRHIFFTALALISITVLFVLLVYKLFFVVEEVSVSGTQHYTEEEILLSSGFAVGDNLYSFAADDAEDTIKPRLDAYGADC